MSLCRLCNGSDCGKKVNAGYDLCTKCSKAKPDAMMRKSNRELLLAARTEMILQGEAEAPAEEVDEFEEHEAIAGVEIGFPKLLIKDFTDKEFSCKEPYVIDVLQQGRRTHDAIAEKLRRRVFDACDCIQAVSRFRVVDGACELYTMSEAFQLYMRLSGKAYVAVLLGVELMESAQHFRRHDQVSELSLLRADIAGPARILLVARKYVPIWSSGELGLHVTIDDQLCSAPSTVPRVVKYVARQSDNIARKAHELRLGVNAHPPAESWMLNVLSKKESRPENAAKVQASLNSVGVRSSQEGYMMLDHSGKYEAELVDYMSEYDLQIAFSEATGRVLCVHGARGSGKSWFIRNALPNVYELEVELVKQEDDAIERALQRLGDVTGKTVIFSCELTDAHTRELCHYTNVSRDVRIVLETEHAVVEPFEVVSQAWVPSKRVMFDVLAQFPGLTVDAMSLLSIHCRDFQDCNLQRLKEAARAMHGVQDVSVALKDFEMRFLRLKLVDICHLSNTLRAATLDGLDADLLTARGVVLREFSEALLTPGGLKSAMRSHRMLILKLSLGRRVTKSVHETVWTDFFRLVVLSLPGVEV